MEDFKPSLRSAKIVSLVLTPFLIAWRAYVLTVMWEWFIVPLGVVALTVPVAAGILVTHYLFVQVRPQDLIEFERDQVMYSIRANALSIIKPAYTLFIGWLVTFFL